MVVSVIVDYSRSRMLIRAAKDHRSQALEADALHFSTNMLSSAVVIAGLGALYAVESLPETSALRPWLERADALAALGVSVIVLKISWSLGKRAVNVLLDAGDMNLAQDVRVTLHALFGVRQIESVRIRHSGPNLFVDIELAAKGSLVLDDAEYLRREVIKKVVEKAEHANVAVVISSHDHNEGDRIARLRGLAAAHGLVVHAMDVLELETAPTSDIPGNGADRVLVEMHVEFSPETPLEEAFYKVSTF
jgi:cation diffusion facilitator family transporter